MPAPSWWEELIGISDVLAAENQADAEYWREHPQVDEDGLPLSEVEEDEFLATVRLAGIGQAFVRHASAFTPEQRRRMFDLLERVLAMGSECDSTAVATGFFEALLSAWNRGFDLRLIWDDLGPESRAYCLAWNKFSGIESPRWMR